MDRYKLNDKNLKTLQPRARRYRVWDTEIPGFYVQVSRSGNAAFYYRYRWHGLARDFKLGSYGALTTAQARKLAKIAAGDVAKGIDVHTKRKTGLHAERQLRRATPGAPQKTDSARFKLVRKQGAGQQYVELLTS